MKAIASNAECSNIDDLLITNPTGREITGDPDCSDVCICWEFVSLA